MPKEQGNSKKTAKLRALDFFCGAGGVTCGFRQVGINVIGGIDIDQGLKDTYELNNPGSKFLRSDIGSLEKEEVSQFFGIDPWDDTLIFVGCSPCQHFTNLKTDKTKSRKTRLLLEDFQEFVSHFMPGFVFIENVPGLETKKKISPLSRFKKFLKKKNYAFNDGVLNAKYFGVPQNRKRYVLIASRLEEKIELPEENRINVKSVKDAIGNQQLYPPIEAGHKDQTHYNHSAAALSALNLKRIKKTPINGGDRRSWADDPELQLNCYKNHTGHYDVYGRMKWEEPSPALTTRFCSYSNGRYGHPVQNRAISLREGAAIQSFPPEYLFYSNNQGTVAKMIGNAVPPKLAANIGAHLQNIFTNS